MGNMSLEVWKKTDGTEVLLQILINMMKFLIVIVNMNMMGLITWAA
jgi:hypothetical protein